MKAIIIRKFVIEDEKLKDIIQNDIVDDRDLEWYLREMTSCELDDICSNCISKDTKVKFEVSIR